MKKRTKVLLIALCAVVLAASTVIGTLAYFTSKVEIVNTFTVGKVSLTMDEAITDENGVASDPVNNRGSSGNKYRLLPGNSYTKDPTVTVKGGSDASYVRVIVIANNRDTLQAIIDNDKNGIDGFADYLLGRDDNWECMTANYKDAEHLAKDEIAFELRYRTDSGEKTTTRSELDQVLPAVFTGFKVPDAVNAAEIDELNDLTLKVEAHAIQVSGFENNEDGAWAAFEAQING